MRVIGMLLVVVSTVTFAAANAVAPRKVAAFKSQAAGDRTEAVTIPQMLSYQGKLTDTLGVPVADTTYSVTFRLYDAPSGGSPFWSETQSVTTKTGLFGVLLGSVMPIGSMPDAGAAYIAMAVGGGSELTPRLRVASSAYAYLAARAADADRLQGKDTAAFATANHNHDATYVNEGQGNSVTSAMLVNGTIAAADLGQMGASSGQVMKWTGSAWASANDSIGGTGDNAWVRSGSDSVLYTAHPLGLAKSGNVLLGNTKHTHVNFGVACTTGSALNDSFTTVSGGKWNSVSRAFGAVGGGAENQVAAPYSVVAGGEACLADGAHASVGGGNWNQASGEGASVAGGEGNIAYYDYAVVCGGLENDADQYGSAIGGGEGNFVEADFGTIGGGADNWTAAAGATVGGGENNDATGGAATVAGGSGNAASGVTSAVTGGSNNLASGDCSSVAGGFADTAAADYSFAVGNASVVPADYGNSAAFNGQTATASSQTRVGVLSKASGTFTIDHPLDPQGEILNHYFIEGPEMLNVYRGSVVLDAGGRADVSLPDYFEALNRNPMVQLTGVGTSEVYVADDVSGNRFAIGGKPGTKVYWIVTGERKDMSAEVTRRMMPVEQPKTGALAGRALDDDFLAGCMDQLARDGKAQGIDFRTAAGRQRYENAKQTRALGHRDRIRSKAESRRLAGKQRAEERKRLRAERQAVRQLERRANRPARTRRAEAPKPHVGKLDSR